jgi:hypothetical protein
MIILTTSLTVVALIHVGCTLIGPRITDGK